MEIAVPTAGQNEPHIVTLQRDMIQQPTVWVTAADANGSWDFLATRPIDSDTSE